MIVYKAQTLPERFSSLEMLRRDMPFRHHVLKTRAEQELPDDCEWYKHEDGYEWTAVGQDRPEDLLRNDGIGGKPVLLGDGRKWLVPCVFKFQVGCVLPSRLVISSEGKVMEICPKYQAAAQIADKISNIIYDGEELPNDPELFAMLMVPILQLNYNITEEALLALGLISTDTFMSFCHQVVDYESVLQYMLAEEEGQKKGSTGSSTSSAAGITSLKASSDLPKL
jgi:hypothetical protein